MYGGMRTGRKGGTRGTAEPALIGYQPEVQPIAGGYGNQWQEAGMCLEGLPGLGRRPMENNTSGDCELLTDQQLHEWLGQTSAMSAREQKLD